MTQEDIISYMKTVTQSQQSLTRNKSLHRCPCCGEPLDGPVGRSRCFEDVSICLTCQSKETYIKRFGKSSDLWKNLPDKPKTWWIIQTYDEAGPFPSDNNLRVMEPQVNDDGTITFLDSECYFNWAKKFGLAPSIFENGDTWLNVYFTVDPKTHAVSVEYTVDDNEKNESYVYVPTAEDANAIFLAADRYCQQHRESLQDIVGSVIPATQEQEFEIQVKEINYGFARIRASSLEDAMSKVHDAYGNGEIEWGKVEFDIL